MKSGRTVLEAKRLGVFSCFPETPLYQAAQQMQAEDISALVVVDAEGYLTGIVTRIDLLRAYLQNPEGWSTQPVTEVMTREVVTVRLETTLHEVAEILMARHIHRVVVVEAEGEKLRPLAVVSDGDLLYHLGKEA